MTLALGLDDLKGWGKPLRINEIPIVPVYYPAKPQPREHTWRNKRGKKTLLS